MTESVPHVGTLYGAVEAWATARPSSVAVTDAHGRTRSYERFVADVRAHAAQLDAYAGHPPSSWPPAVRRTTFAVPTSLLPSDEDATRIVAAMVRGSVTPVPRSDDRHDRRDGHAPIDRAPPEPEPIGPDSIAWWLRTSGTTGPPTVVGHTHRSVLAAATSIAATLHLAHDDVGLIVAPLSLSTGMVHLSCVLATGGHALFASAREPQAWARAAIDHGATWTCAPPALLAAFVAGLRQLGATRADLRMRVVRCTSATPPASLRDTLESEYGIAVAASYGMTECPNVAGQGPFTHRRDPLGVGVLRGVDVHVVDEEGVPVAHGRTGRIVVSSPTRLARTLHGPPPTTLTTDDLGRFGRDGELIVVGRVGDLIDRGGVKVAPLEVDRALESHPAVDAAAACAVPHATLGSDVVALVVLREGMHATVHELRDHLANLLSPAACPSDLLVVDDLPRLHGGKVDRAGASEAYRRSVANASGPGERPVGRRRIDLETAWIDAVTDALDGIVPNVSSNFFTVGGDSLSAATVASSLSKRVGAEVRIASIMRYPTARAWAEAWQRERNASIDTKDP